MFVSTMWTKTKTIPSSATCSRSAQKAGVAGAEDE
jgi:hypothetical protein